LNAATTIKHGARSVSLKMGASRIRLKETSTSLKETLAATVTARTAAIGGRNHEDEERAHDVRRLLR